MRKLTLHKARNYFRLIIVGYFLLLSGCISTGGYISGQVLDANTRKPVSNAHVIINWTGFRFMIADSPQDCFRVDTVLTDSDGKYQLLPWVQADGLFPLMNVYESSVLYKPGYRMFTLPRGEGTPGVNLLKQLPSTSFDAEERLKYLLWVLGRTSCGDIVRENFIPLYRDLYQEALQIVYDMPYTPPQPDLFYLYRDHFGYSRERYQLETQDNYRKKIDKYLNSIKATIVRQWNPGGDVYMSDADSEKYFTEHIEKQLQ